MHARKRFAKTRAHQRSACGKQGFAHRGFVRGFRESGPGLKLPRGDLPRPGGGNLTTKAKVRDWARNAKGNLNPGRKTSVVQKHSTLQGDGYGKVR